MYVDKKLGGVACVQTLSRLNRTTAGKDETFVLDFENSAEDIEKGFQPFYDRVSLSEETDPNQLYNIRTDLEKFGIHEPTNVEAFAQLWFAQLLCRVFDSRVGRLLVLELVAFFFFQLGNVDFFRLKDSLVLEIELELLFCFDRFFLLEVLHHTDVGYTESVDSRNCFLFRAFLRRLNNLWGCVHRRSISLELRKPVCELGILV
jgi:hypothetical protein